MIRIEEVRTKKQQNEFMNFPIRMYHGNPSFIPPLWMDEKQIFSADYAYYKTCEAVYYLAYDGEKIVGRISGILQKAANEKWKQKRVRFTRFDCIDSEEVAKALFDAVEDWAKSKGMNEVCGPLGFSDLEREGLLIEGFDQPSTFEEQYNAPYYGELIEKCGYRKEVDWLESQIRVPKEKDPKLPKVSEYLLKRNKLHFATAKNKKEYLKKYASMVLGLVDDGYDALYGTVPLTPEIRDMIMKGFNLVIDPRFIRLILSENEEPVAMGFCFPAIGESLKRSGGHLTPLTLLRVLHDLKHPKVLEFALIAVHPRYAERGIGAVMVNELVNLLEIPGVERGETNLNLEDNAPIRNMWSHFDSFENKRRRSYVKALKN